MGAGVSDSARTDDTTLGDGSNRSSGLGRALDRREAGIATGGWSEQRAAAGVRAALFGEPLRPLLARYELLGAIGRGAMGEVWRARDPLLDRTVAIKLIAPGAHADATTVQRVGREARSLARLSHPNVVQIYDVGSHTAMNGTAALFIVMELVDGRALDAWLVRARRSPAEIIDVFVQAGRGLAAAHDVGLVHRDFKPANVLVGDDGRVRVGDFGLARLVDSLMPLAAAERAADEAAVAHTLAGSLTGSGIVVGTPLYMAPEQHEGGSIDGRSDQYAFCVALAESLLGRRLFGGGLRELASAKRSGPSVSPREHALLAHALGDGGLAAILRGLSPRADARWPSMHALLHALRRRPVRRRWAVGFVAAAVIALGFAASPRERTCASDVDGGPKRLQAERAIGAVLAPQPAIAARERLDAWRAELHEQRRDSCTADPDQTSGKAACLQRASQHLDAAYGVIADGPIDAERVGRVIDGLPDLRACERATVDASPLAAELDRRLATASVLVTAGRYDEAMAEARAVRDELEDPATRLGHEALYVEAALAIADVHAALVERTAAMEAYESAYYAAIERGLDAQAFRAARQLAMDRASIGDFADSERWVAHARAAHAAVPVDRQQPWHLEFMRAVIAHYHQDYVAAIAAFGAAIAMCKDNDAPSCRGVLRKARVDTARAWSLLHDYPRAAAAWQQEYGRAVAELGPRSPAALLARVHIADVTGEQDPAAGLAMSTEVLAEIEAATPPIDDLLGEARLVHAELQVENGDVRGGLGTALAAAEGARGRSGLGELRSVALGRAASYAEDAGELELALSLYQEAAGPGAGLAVRIILLINRAALLGRRGEPARGLADLREAIDLADEHFMPTSGHGAVARYNLVLTLHDLERCDELVVEATPALAVARYAADAITARRYESDIRLTRAICRARAGDREGAIADLVAALATAPAGWSNREGAMGRLVELRGQ
jgi:tetratricopeptide (TPR) repeat protein